MTGVIFFPLLLIVIGLVIVLPIVLICILLGRRRTPAALPPMQPATTEIPEARNQRREAILGRLANKEITRDEAEQQLLELDKPLPEQMPVAPPPARNGCGRGCLVAVICGIVAVVLLLLLLFGLFFGFRVQNVHHQNAIQIERMR